MTQRCDVCAAEKKLSKNDNLKREYCEQINNLLKMGTQSQRRINLHPNACGTCLISPSRIRRRRKSALSLMRPPTGPRSGVGRHQEMFPGQNQKRRSRQLRFLWRNNMNENPQEYRMTSLIFGAASSFCTAIYIKNRNASEFELEYPEACKAIRLDHYVDDFEKFNSIEEAKRVSKQVYEIHRKAAFELRGWASNEIEVLNEMPDTRNDDTPGRTHELKNPAYSGTSIMTPWVSISACGTRLLVLETSLPPTKRQVTSAVMSVFDPLGLASPVLITGKCMLQDIWRSGIDWDETIEADAHKKWLKWVNDIKKLASIRIPRCISPGHTEGSYMCSSTRAKSRTLRPYWRIKLSEHESAVSLIAGKLASILIRSDPRSFKPFVAHRLAELEEHTTVKCWRWVPTKLNVADDATRDPPTHFDETHRWFHGPDFCAKAKTNGRRKLLKANDRRGGEIMYDVDTGQ
ncbi:hypothetical protein EVAR_11563_1 [Eumeta japonica]|uniref:Uncharacterized protein n=1 Tax=Eumeta variegata TaxID=151549 RepID=A0A4C1X7Q8_EUMVA|nr:hypothetical protein EVAR_11563_1 [Eumeta japonica]